MKEFLTKNIDKIGLILNIIGTLIVAFAFGKLENGGETGDGKGKWFHISYLLRPILFNIGISLLVIGFILQFIS